MDASALVAAAAVLLASASVRGDERNAVVPWETLAQVSVTRQKDRYVPEFSRQILALDKREVKLKGFMLPLEHGLRQKRYVTEPIVVSGTFALVRDDSGGLLYRLTEAAIVEK